MPEVTKQEKSYDVGRRLRQTLGLGGAGLLLGGLVAPWYFTHHETTTEIAATEVGITPNFDGVIRIESGIVVPDSRLSTDSLIGLDITVGNTTIPGEGMTSDITDKLAATYGGVATNPDGELEEIRTVVVDQAVKAGVLGLGTATLPTAAYLLIGKRRREELAQTIHNAHAPLIGGIAVCLVAGIATTQTSEPSNEPSSSTWIPIHEAIPGISDIPELRNVEVKNNAMTGITRSLLQGAVQTYEKSKPFYDQLEKTVEEHAMQFREPGEDEMVALIVSDRHDNIAMDPVLRATADSSGASMLITLGDDTSSGKSWEAFSLRSLNSNFEDMTRIAVGGNHDNGSYVINTLKEYGFTVPNEEVQTVNDITIAMANDPRKSDFTPEKREGEVPYDEAAEQLAELACAEEDGVDIVLVHSASMGSPALEEGCTGLVVGGHAHSYSAPLPVIGPNGSTGYTVTNGTSGGALFAFAAGTKLKREANSLLVTFSDDGTPLGTQNVRYMPNGSVIVDEFIELQIRDSDDDIAAKEPKQKDGTARPINTPLKESVSRSK